MSESSHSENERLVYVVTKDQLSDESTGPISLIFLWSVLWRAKWLVIGVTTLFASLSIPYALSLTEWYRSDVLLAPAERRSTQNLFAEQLGGLASLAGVSVGSTNSAEPLAILRSRDFVRAFIEEENLLPVLFAEQWDEESASWLANEPEGIPDMRDAVRVFQESVLAVSEEQGTGLVTLAVVWTDPTIAAEWADRLVARVNENLRGRALQEAETNVSYLEEELAATSVVTLQQSIGRLLETELQKVMLARGNEEFAFRVIDRAQVPLQRFRPNRRLIVVIATLLGGFLSVVGIFLYHSVQTIRRTAEAEIEAARSAADEPV